MAKAFAEQFNFAGKLLVDPSRAVYEALKCKRGAGAAINFKMLKAAKRAYAEGYRQGKTQGDGLQLGGVFVFRKDEGIVWSYLEEYAGDHPPLEDIVKAVEECTGKKRTMEVPAKEQTKKKNRKKDAKKSGKAREEGGDSTDEEDEK